MELQRVYSHIACRQTQTFFRNAKVCYALQHFYPLKRRECHNLFIAKLSLKSTGKMP